MHMGRSSQYPLASPPIILTYALLFSAAQSARNWATSKRIAVSISALDVLLGDQDIPPIAKSKTKLIKHGKKKENSDQDGL